MATKLEQFAEDVSKDPALESELMAYLEGGCVCAVIGGGATRRH